ncbi:MAG: D-alanyl-D-alanine endopeptidase [Proteobacteria bacterium]|nr:D-alanyl-D-alanine endopeptidase [Pseudomonadota bacterium]
MNKATLVLLTLLGLSLTAGPSLANAEQKKKVVAVKKHKPYAKKRGSKAAMQDSSHLFVQSASALVLDQSTGTVLFEKNAGAVLPIASITKLMTAMVTLDSKPDLNEILTISDEDVDTLKGTRSRLKVGTNLNREEMLRLALMSSENRAASSLASNYPGGRTAFIAAMNRKATELGLQDTQFSDPTGLTAANVSSAHDLVKMVAFAHQYPLIREFTTATEYEVKIAGRTQAFHNTNSLVKSASWDIGLSKTGYINEAGKCLVMQAWLNNKPTIIVLLDSLGKMTRIGDANRIKRWVETASLARHPTSG